jgi:hypothetical protein
MEAGPISVVARMRTTDGTELAQACSFTTDEWELLTRFATYAEELSRTTLMTTPGRLSFSVSSREEGGTHFEPVSMPAPDDFRALLLLMRPFVLSSEDTYFSRVRNILSRRLDHPAFRAYLDRQRAIFNAERCQGMLLVANDVVVNSIRTLDLWLNGYAYHRDEDKRTSFPALHERGVLPTELSEALMVATMLERARAVIDLGNAIYSLQRNQVIAPFPES